MDFVALDRGVKLIVVQVPNQYNDNKITYNINIYNKYIKNSLIWYNLTKND